MITKAMSIVSGLLFILFASYWIGQTKPTLSEQIIEQRRILDSLNTKLDTLNAENKVNITRL